MESDGVNFIVGDADGKNCTKSIVGGIGFNDNRCIGNPMCKNRCCCESFLQSIESIASGIGEMPRSVLPSESGERNCDVGVVRNETTVENWQNLKKTECPLFSLVQANPG